jgi:two-component sensor histidine kinase
MPTTCPRPVPGLKGSPRCYAADAHAPGDARLHVRAQLGVWRLMSLAEDVELAASELVTNAVVHGSRGESDQIRLLLELTGWSVLVRVWDANPAPPELRSPDPWAEHGNGLLLVDSLSLRWGSYPADGGGKVVWCEIDRRDPGLTADVTGAGKVAS